MDGRRIDMGRWNPDGAKNMASISNKFTKTIIIPFRGVDRYGGI
jgi:hypothetical protein